MSKTKLIHLPKHETSVRALCNGRWGQQITRDAKQVTCEKCQAKGG